jgi:hypothetical protein
MKIKFLNKNLICSIIFSVAVLFANAQETKRFYPTNMSQIGMTKKADADVYAEQNATSTKELFVGYDNSTQSYGRGYLVFDLTGIPSGAQIKDVYLALFPKIKWDSNFAKDIDVKITHSSFYALLLDGVVWSQLTGGPEIARVKFPNEGFGMPVRSDYLKAYVSDYIGKKIYLGIQLSNENKVVRLATDTDFFLEVVYTPATPTITPKAATISINNVSTTSVNFNWDDVKADYYNYTIKKGNQVIVSKENINQVDCSEINLLPDTKYTLSVDAAFKQSSGNYTTKTSTKEFVTKPLAPGAPQNIKAQITADSWVKNSRGCTISFDMITGSNWDIDYTVYELNYPLNGTYKQKYTGTQVGISKNTHLIKNLDYGKTYYLGVTAKNVTGEGAWEVVSITTLATSAYSKPVAPTNFITKLWAANTEASRALNWTYPDAERNNITGFEIVKFEGTNIKKDDWSSFAINIGTNCWLFPAKSNGVLLGEVPYIAGQLNLHAYTIYARNGDLKSDPVSLGFKISAPQIRSASSAIDDVNEEKKITVIGDKLSVIGIKNYSVKIFDQAGRLVMNNVSPGGNEIDISSLNKGIYIIHVVTADDTIIEKIMKN